MNKTSELEAVKRKAILDGMLFEIFFNSDGQRREVPKARAMNETFRLQRYIELASSFNFIAACLTPYAELYYRLPGSSGDAAIDVTGEVSPEGSFMQLTSVRFEGREVLRDERSAEAEDIFGFGFTRRLTTDEFVDLASAQMVIPKPSLVAKFHFAHTETTVINFPSYLSLRKHI
jgi:hypothetical protein